MHDAVLIAAPLDRLDADVAAMQEAVREASRIVLDGFELGTEAEIIRHSDRYFDPLGIVMWDRVMALLAAAEGKEVARAPEIMPD